MTKKTSLLVVLLSALIMVAMMSAMAFAYDKDIPTDATLYIGGVKVENNGRVTGEGIKGDVGVVFNGNNATLTLENAQISGINPDADIGGYTSNIFSNKLNLTIVLIGSNTVGNSDTPNTQQAIKVYTDGNDISKTLTIQGSGSLAVDGIYNAIYTTYDCKIENGELTAKSTKLENENDGAICALHGNVEISGAKTKVTATSVNGDTICGKNISIKKGAVVDVTSSGNEEAIYSDGGNITIDSSEVKVNSGYAAFDCMNTTISNSVVSAKGGYYAVRAYGMIDIENSKMENTEGEIFTEDLVIQDSKVNVKGEYMALNAGAIDIKNTEKGYSTYVEAEVKKSQLESTGLSINRMDSSYAVRASEDSLKINDLGITLPENGKIENYEESIEESIDEHIFKCATVMDGKTPATHVIIEIPKNNITIEKTTGGDVKVEPEKAAEGEEVKVIATPDEGYEVEKIVIIDADGKEIDITDKASFIMGKKNVTVKVNFKKKTTPTPPTPTPSKAKPVSVVKGIAKGKTSLKFTWNKVEGAAKYELWMSKCNTAKKKYTVKRVKRLGADKTTYTRKELRPYTAYKFRIVAKDASGNVISKSRICHAYTSNVKGKRTNVKSLKLSKKSFTLNKGGTAKIKATQTKARLGKKLCSHARKLRYKSNNTSVANVDKSGKITAVGTGTCKIYVQSVNGIWKTVKVTVN